MPTGDKTSMQARLSYARVLVEVWELDDAEAQLAGVLEEWPDEVTALDLLAKIKHIRGELTEAIACWAQVHARSSPKQAGAHLRLNSLLQLARDTERGGRDFLVLGPYQLWRKPAAHLELEEVFRLFLARRPDEARARCDQLARKYHGKDQDLYKLAVLANAWIAELSGDLDRAQSILEELGSERGFENDKDRLLALARLYEKVGATELLRKAVNIYLHFERDYETVSALGNLSVLYLRLGDEGEAARYHRRFLDLFRRRMHRPTLAEAIQVSAIRYVPLYKLCKIRFAGTDGPPELAPRERAIGLAMAIAVAGGCEREHREFDKPALAANPRAQAAALPDLQPGQPGRGMQSTASAGGYNERSAYEIAQGKQLFRWYNCVGCHAQGGGGIGPALMDDQWIYGSSPEAIFATIVEGRPNGMPSFRGRIPEAQVWQLVAYVRSLPRDAAGRPQELAGDADLAVTFVASAGGGTGRPSFSGPARARPSWPALREYALVSQAGGRVVFGLGTDRRLPFRVVELTRPARVVVDVAN